MKRSLEEKGRWGGVSLVNPTGVKEGGQWGVRDVPKTEVYSNCDERSSSGSCNDKDSYYRYSRRRGN